MRSTRLQDSPHRFAWPGVTALLLLSASMACGPKEPLPAAEGFVTVQGGGKLFYQVRGEGRPVVLIHGGATHLGMWDDQFDELARHYKVVRYDVRGFGRSSTSQQEHAQWDDLRTLLDSLGIERTHIVGLSLGGRIAIDFALEEPDRVDHLVLAGPGLSGWQFQPAPWMEEIGAALEAGDRRAASDAWLRSPYLEAAMENPELAERLRRITYETEHSWVKVFYAVPPSPRPVDRLAELEAPVLLIVGERDASEVHRIADKIAAEAPNVKKVLFEGAGHMVNMERPEEFNRAVLEFLPR